MEANVRQQAQLEFLWDDELFIDGSQTAVQDADEHFQGCRDGGEGVFQPEEALGRRDISKRTQGKGDGGKSKADDGQVLEMPAICIVSVKHMSLLSLPQSSRERTWGLDSLRGWIETLAAR